MWKNEKILKIVWLIIRADIQQSDDQNLFFPPICLFANKVNAFKSVAMTELFMHKGGNVAVCSLVTSPCFASFP